MNLSDQIYYRLLENKFVVIDDFFPESLCHELRKIALNFEGIDDVYPDYHSINYYNPIYNISCKLKEEDYRLICSDIPNYLKDIFPFLTENEMDFQRGWYFIHDNKQYHSVKKHIDYGAYITVNLWVTPDENRESITEKFDGFMIYVTENPTVIPYRFNRMTIFFSETFHESQLCNFKNGNDMRKVNYTFLFGKDCSEKIGKS